MAIKSSGTFLRFSEIASEFNDSQPHSMSEFTRGGILVPDSASNSLIRSVAQRAAGGANGRMKFSDYYGAANGFGITIASTVTDLDLATLFNTAQSGIWASSEAKVLTINSGIIVGATSTGNAALTIPSGMGGTLVIVNNGAIQGAGGASSGAVGGDAISVLSSGVSITNNGDIYAGGGAGGAGGAGGDGGDGSYNTTSYGTGTPYQAPNQSGSYCNTSCVLAYGSNSYCTSTSQNTTTGSVCYYFFWRNEYTCTAVGGNTGCAIVTVNIVNGGSGGAGGNGGVGQGYNQAAGSGVDPGANGGASNGNGSGAGGNGGTGGDGGSFGTSGASGTQGSAGSQGTASNGLAGLAGLAGGAAGDYISGISNVTFTNNGNTAGTTS